MTAQDIINLEETITLDNITTKGFITKLRRGNNTRYYLNIIESPEYTSFCSIENNVLLDDVFKETQHIKNIIISLTSETEKHITYDEYLMELIK